MGRRDLASHLIFAKGLAEAVAIDAEDVHERALVRADARHAAERGVVERPGPEPRGRLQQPEQHRLDEAGRRLRDVGRQLGAIVHTAVPTDSRRGYGRGKHLRNALKLKSTNKSWKMVS